MAPIATDSPQKDVSTDDVAQLKERLAKVDLDKVKQLTLPPDNTLKRYLKAGIDLSDGYPYFPPKPDFVEDVTKIREQVRDKPYVDPGTRADPEKKALFGAAKKVTNLTTNIGVSVQASCRALLVAVDRCELI